MGAKDEAEEKSKSLIQQILPASKLESEPDVLAQMAALKKKAEAIKDETGALKDESENKPPINQQGLNDLKNKVNNLESKVNKVKGIAESVGKVAAATLVVAATLGGGPLGLAVATVAVAGVKALWNWANKEKKPEAPKPNGNDPIKAQIKTASVKPESKSQLTTTTPRLDFIAKADRVIPELKATGNVKLADEFSKVGRYAPLAEHPNMVLVVSDNASPKIEIPPVGNRTQQQRIEQLQAAVELAQKAGWQTIDFSPNAFNQEEMKAVQDACDKQGLTLSDETRAAYAAALEDTDELDFEQSNSPSNP